MFCHAVVQDNVDYCREVDGVIGGDIDNISAPTKYVGAEVAIFGTEDIEGPFRMLIVGQRMGILAALDGNGDTVIRYD
jgi:hypothetical protein